MQEEMDWYEPYRIPGPGEIGSTPMESSMPEAARGPRWFQRDLIEGNPCMVGQSGSGGRGTVKETMPDHTPYAS